jgi:hypothetical protein
LCEAQIKARKKISRIIPIPLPLPGGKNFAKIAKERLRLGLSLLLTKGVNKKK